MEICLHCGSPLKGKQQKYCSSNCTKAAWKVRNKEQSNKINQEYNAKRMRIKKKRTERLVRKTKKVCLFCGKELELNKHNYSTKKYCSANCRNYVFALRNPDKIKQYAKKERRNHKERYKKWNAEYKDKIRFGGNRRKVMQRDEFTCQDCFKGYPDVKLIVHHKDRDKENNSLDNLVTLCRACHINEHRS